MRKKVLALISVLALTLSACGQSDVETNATDTSALVESGETMNGESTPESGQVSENTEGTDSAEEIWVPAEAPAVRAEVSDEEQREQELAILAKGTFLYSGETDIGFYPSDISWLTSAQKTDAVAVIYACDDLTHGGWGVLGLAVDGGLGQKQMDIAAMSDEPDKERLVIYTVDELLTLAGCKEVSEFKNFTLGAWNGGLYYLPSSIVEELNAYRAQVEETEQIIHTYTGELSNENAIESAQVLYDYLQETYGTACLTGQMESTWMGSPDYEMNYIEDNTGKLPAIRGLDFMPS